MEQWQDAASQQVKLLTARLNELVSEGVGLLRSELGVDLGLQPELIPPWVVLLAAGSGLLLMVALWASLCRALFSKQPAGDTVDEALSKPDPPEEPKKRKRKAEKKVQPNGRAVAEPQEEAVASEETEPHHQPPTPEVKAEKVSELKKSKKKAKQAIKETKTATTDGKEPEEGTWETKVSNKEKREQRKKDKSSSDGSASPGGGDMTVSAAPEHPKASTVPTSTSQKKKKDSKVKPEKAVVSEVNSTEAVAVAAGGTDMAVKAPAPPVALKTGPWTASREPASLWRADIDDSWTVIDRDMTTTDQNLVSLTGLGVGSAEPLPVSPPSWFSQPRVDDEWSGHNGSSVDPSSDWNAPAEVWGNYEEPTRESPPALEQPCPEPAKADLFIGVADDDDDEKDKGEAAADGAAKSKKKKKKKKKAAEEGGASGQGEEPEQEVLMKKQPPVAAAAVQPIRAAAVEARVEQPVKNNISQKPPVTQVPQKPSDGEATAKQNSLSAPTQLKKPDESQAPKPAKKKKARRET